MLPDRIIASLTDNLPEHSLSMGCHGWDYDTRTFLFQDPDDGSEVRVDLDALRKGGALAATAAWPAGIPRPPCGAPEDSPLWERWLDRTDASAVDALVQLAAFGEVVYG